MKYVNADLIRKNASPKLLLCFEKYLSRYFGTMMEIHHSAELIRRISEDDEIVKEFLNLHYEESKGD